MTMWIIAAVVELAAIVALGVLLVVSRKKLRDTRNALERIRSDSPRRRWRGIASRALRALYPRAQEDELLRWKLIRCFQSFNNEAINTLLTGIEHNDPNPAIRQEAHRSLTVLAGRSKM